MKKKITALCLCVCMLAIALASGTMAYFTDKDAKKNVMTTGKVDIVQNEQQRATDGTLVDFVQNKPLMPAVYTIAIDGSNIVQNGYFNAGINNVVDKIITVTNQAELKEETSELNKQLNENNSAYVRTILAFETNTSYEEGTANVLVDGKTIFDTYFCLLGDFDLLTRETIKIDGTEYVLAVKLYEDALVPEATTTPSLKQIYMSPGANNEVATLFGSEYTILALSQATQVAGFADAKTALDTAFGDLENIDEAKLIEWLSECETE